MANETRTKDLKATNGWVELLPAGVLGAIYLQVGEVVIRRSASAPDASIVTGVTLSDFAESIEDDRVYKPHEVSDLSLKVWGRCVNGSVATLVIDEGGAPVGSSGGSTSIDTSLLSKEAKQAEIIVLLQAALKLMGADAGLTTKPFDEYQLRYDANGNIAIKKQFAAGVFVEEFRYTYDANGNLISAKRYATETT